MASSTSPESSSKPSGAAASCSSSDTGDTELTMVNLAALQEDIHRMENPNFDVQKQTVRELFDRGIPFFTRPAMEQLKGQIDAIKSMVMKGESTDGQKFVVLSITGQTVERAVLKGLAQSRQLGNETVLYVLFLPKSTSLHPVPSPSSCQHTQKSKPYKCPVTLGLPVTMSSTPRNMARAT